MTYAFYALFFSHSVATTAEGNNNWIVAAASDGSGGASNGDAGRSAVLERIGNDTLLLTLFLPSVSPEDSGQYSCSPANAAPARISFHVVTGTCLKGILISIVMMDSTDTFVSRMSGRDEISVAR